MVQVLAVSSILAAWLAFTSPMTKKVRKIPLFHHMEYWGTVELSNLTEICCGQAGVETMSPGMNNWLLYRRRYLLLCCFALKDWWILVVWLPGCPRRPSLAVRVQQLAAVVPSVLKPAVTSVRAWAKSSWRPHGHGAQKKETLPANVAWSAWSLSQLKLRVDPVWNWSYYYMPKGQFGCCFVAHVSFL